MNKRILNIILLAATSLPMIGCTTYGYEGSYGTSSNQVYYRHAAYSQAQPQPCVRYQQPETFLYNRMYAPQYSPVINRSYDTLVVSRPDGINEIHPAPMR
jgi:hypothetical protein